MGGISCRPSRLLLSCIYMKLNSTLRRLIIGSMRLAATKTHVIMAVRYIDGVGDVTRTGTNVSVSVSRISSSSSGRMNLQSGSQRQLYRLAADMKASVNH